MKIAIFGKLSNLGWGLESLISHAQDRVSVPMQLYDYSELDLRCSDDTITHAVFIQGRGIDRKGPAWRRLRAKKILWNAEFLPYAGFETHPEAMARLQAIEPLEDFDMILNGCPLSARWLREARGLDARWFPMMGVDPIVHRRIPGIERDIDVGFYGTVSDRRARLFRAIALPLLDRGLTVYWTNVWGEGLIRFINRCKVVLNLHFADLLNTESRIYEVLGCGAAACLSEPISTPEVFPAGEYLEVAEGPEEMAEAIHFLLANSNYREAMAAAGRENVYRNYSIDKVLEMLIAHCSSIEEKFHG